MPYLYQFTNPYEREIAIGTWLVQQKIKDLKKERKFLIEKNLGSVEKLKEMDVLIETHRMILKDLFKYCCYSLCLSFAIYQIAALFHHKEVPAIDI